MRGAWFIAICLSAVLPAHGDSEDFNRMALARVKTPSLGLPPVPVPGDNVLSAEKVALGRKLFFDRRLSKNATMSCAMCHIPEQGFTNNEVRTPVGINGQGLRRNAPTIINVAYQQSLFHDGRETRLETQVILPLIAADEMANPSVGYLVAKITALPDYDGLFEAAFDGGPTIDRIGMAIASWERTILAAGSHFDRWYFGDETDALSVEQVKGFEIFAGKGNCTACHLIGDEFALFTDHGFHNTGVGVSRGEGTKVRVEIAPGVHTLIDRAVVDSVGVPRQPDSGRLEVTEDPEDLHRFKTPSLRNVALSAPYMHDGSLSTLEAVVRFYNRGGVPHDGLDPLIGPLNLSDAEIDALVSFLQSLTSPGVESLIEDARSIPPGN